MQNKREKNPAAVAMGKLTLEKHGIKHYQEIGKKGMAVRWYGHVKAVRTHVKTSKNVPSENTSNTNNEQSESQS